MILVLSCEHAGNRVPARYEDLFQSRRARTALASHRGVDIGALAVARALARSLGAPLFSVTVTRLLVEANRSLGHPDLFSEFSRRLSPRDKQVLLDRYYYPHRRRVESAVRRSIGLTIHVGVHSFAPRLKGVSRSADVGLLYDPSRPAERRFCDRWADALRLHAPDWIVRRNYPYRGTADGLTTALRRQLPPGAYAGIELEVNQRLLFGPRSLRRTADVLVGSLADMFS